MSNYLKKPGQHDFQDEPIKCIGILGPKHGLPQIMRTYIYEGRIIPNRVIENHKAYEIIEIHKGFCIYGFTITATPNGNVHHITVTGLHPNVDDSNIYCLPKEQINKLKYPDDLGYIINHKLKVHYLDNAHFLPSKKFVDYRPIPTIGKINMTKGEMILWQKPR